MAFDPTRDKTLKSKVFDADKDDQKIEVKLVSYDGGPEKMQISRFSEVGGKESPMRKFLKLGRMTVKEAVSVRDAITELTAGE